jgi:hypothetical protein
MLLITIAFPSVAETEITDYTQTRVADIFSIDYESRTAVIGTYTYGFSGLHGYDLPVVKLYGSDAGAFEVLTIGMRVQVTYRISPSLRYVTSLEEVAKDTPLGVPDAFVGGKWRNTD